MARIYTTAGTAVASAVTVTDIDPNFPRVTVAISYFDDATLTTPSTSPVGTFAVEGITTGGQTYTDFANSPIDSAIDGSFASAASPLDTVRITPNGVSGTSYYQATITANRS